MPDTTSTHRPLIALAMGDPAGISAELAAKVLRDERRPDADFIVIGDSRVMALGSEQAGIENPIETVGLFGPVAADKAPVMLDLGNLDPAGIEIGRSSAEGGAFSLTNFRIALELADAGIVDAVCFTPFNKHSNRLAQPDFVDEIEFIAGVVGGDARGSEFNVLDEVWNARVTSHVPMSTVAGLLTPERILRSIRLTEQCMRQAGHAKPRIAVAALNPHAGDGGNFGHEDDGIIRPAVEQAQALQISVEGPFPADTVFMRALRGDFDVVLTMYHDQGQIAMKLIGFDRGVTLIGGYPFLIATPAHGTAYDIAGKGIANDEATRQALLLVTRMATEAIADKPQRPFASRLREAQAHVRHSMAQPAAQ